MTASAVVYTQQTSNCWTSSKIRTRVTERVSDEARVRGQGLGFTNPGFSEQKIG